MYSMDIMYTDHMQGWERPSEQRPYPELFTVHHNGDYSGDVKINMEADRVKEFCAADSGYARHGNAIVEVEIPFEVLARFIAAYVVSQKIHELETLDDSREWKKALGL